MVKFVRILRVMYGSNQVSKQINKEIVPGSKNRVAKKSSDVVSLLEVNNNVTNDEVKGLIFLLATQLKNTGDNSEKISNIIDTLKPKSLPKNHCQDKKIRTINPFIRACRDGDLGKVEKLLKSGAKIDLKAKFGETALILAAVHGRRNSRTIK